jgi:hypothetical protein
MAGLNPPYGQYFSNGFSRLIQNTAYQLSQQASSNGACSRSFSRKKTARRRFFTETAINAGLITS